MFAFKYNWFKTQRTWFNFFSNVAELPNVDFIKIQYILSIYGHLGIIFVLLHNHLAFLGSNGCFLRKSNFLSSNRGSRQYLDLPWSESFKHLETVIIE